MNSGNWVLRAAGVALVVLVASALSLHTTEYTDKTGACAVKAGAGWKRVPKVEADRSTAALVLAFDANNDSKLPASFMVLISASTQPLDQEARSLADAAKKKVPDQGDYGSIATSKLDGEDARLLISSPPIRFLHPTALVRGPRSVIFFKAACNLRGVCA